MDKLVDEREDQVCTENGQLSLGKGAGPLTLIFGC